MDYHYNSFDFWSDVSKDGIDTIDNLNQVYSSESQIIKIKLITLNWTLTFNRRNDDQDFYVILECSNRSSLWKCDVELEAKFVNGLNSYVIKKKKQCSFVQNKLTAKKSFDNEATNVSVNVCIKVKNVKGIRKFQRFNPLKEEPGLSDVILVFNEKKLKANKAYLTHFSTYFQKLFYGNFSEKNQQEIELKDVIFEEFVDLMNVISPEKKEITNDNVEYILKLADLFDMQTVIDQCETFLVNVSSISYVKKLALADKYLLVDLQDHCVQTATRERITSVRTSDLYSQLNDSTKAALFEETYKLLVDSVPKK